MTRLDMAIRMRNVDVRRNRRLALDQVSFGIPHGVVVSVVGANGAGKSTLLGVISGRFRPSRGSVVVDGSTAEVPQGLTVDVATPLTVEDVVRQGRYRDLGLFRPMSKGDRRIVSRALDVVDLADQRRRPVCELSGGQRQRALVAQGLAQQSPVLLLDEPMTGVDAPTQQRLGQVIREVAESGVTVVFSTHDVDDASSSDMLVALERRCLCCAPIEEALDDPTVTRLFGRRELLPEAPREF